SAPSRRPRGTAAVRASLRSEPVTQRELEQGFSGSCLADARVLRPPETSYGLLGDDLTADQDARPNTTQTCPGKRAPHARTRRVRPGGGQLLRAKEMPLRVIATPVTA